jgi:hypothetical protein
MKLEVLHVRDCPNLTPMLELLAEVTDQPVSTRLIESDADAATFGMAGSPTLLIDGVDPFATADDCGCGMSCRLYRDSEGRIVAAPSAEQLHDAITAATRGTAVRAATVAPAEPGEVLSAGPGPGAAAGPGGAGCAAGDPARLRHYREPA